jgi:N-acetylneuraminic acid mutarotase
MKTLIAGVMILISLGCVNCSFARTKSAIVAPVSVYFDEIGADRIVASAYAPDFKGLNGAAGINIAKDGEYSGWHTNGEVWASKAALPSARYGMGVAAFNGRVYTLSGLLQNGHLLKGAEEYDPVTDTWSTKADMALPRVWGATAIVRGKIYFIGGDLTGGNLTDTNEEYDPESNSWRTRAAMPTTRELMAGAVVNDKIYVIGGHGGAYKSVNEAYDPASDTWSTKAAMPAPRGNLTASAVGGKIYVIGGTYNGTYETRNEEYDPASDTWSTKKAMPTARHNLASAVVGGKIYAFGGYNWNYPIQHLARNEAYDPATDAWLIKPEMPTARVNPGAVAAGGKIYVFGGYFGGGAEALPVNEEYDPGVSTVFTGLTPNTQYSFKAMARDAARVETAASSSAIVYTLAATPLAGGPAYVIMGPSVIKLLWRANGNPVGTQYRAELSTSPKFTNGKTISGTDMIAIFEGLFPDTTYYARVSACNRAGVWTGPRQIADIYVAPAKATTVPLVAAAEEDGAAPAGTHLVVTGDTLWDLSGRYYGDPYKWGRIYAANKEKIANPDRIYPEEKIVIPGITESEKLPGAPKSAGPLILTYPASAPVTPLASENPAAVVAAPALTSGTAAVLAAGKATPVSSPGELSEEMPEDLKEWSDKSLRIVPENWKEDGVITGAINSDEAFPSLPGSLTVTGELVTIKAAGRAAFRPGEVLTSYIRGTIAYDTKTGAKLGMELQKSGTLEVVSVKKKIITARILKSNTSVDEGQVVVH